MIYNIREGDFLGPKRDTLRGVDASGAGNGGGTPWVKRGDCLGVLEKYQSIGAIKMVITKYMTHKDNIEEDLQIYGYLDTIYIDGVYKSKDGETNDGFYIAQIDEEIGVYYATEFYFYDTSLGYFLCGNNTDGGYITWKKTDLMGAEIEVVKKMIDTVNYWQII